MEFKNRMDEICNAMLNRAGLFRRRIEQRVIFFMSLIFLISGLAVDLESRAVAARTDRITHKQLGVRSFAIGNAMDANFIFRDNVAVSREIPTAEGDAKHE